MGFSLVYSFYVWQVGFIWSRTYSSIDAQQVLSIALNLKGEYTHFYCPRCHWRSQEGQGGHVAPGPAQKNPRPLNCATCRWGLLELADTCGYPVGMMPSVKSLISETHPRFIGIYLGSVSTAFCVEIIESAPDLLFCSPHLWNPGSATARCYYKWCMEPLLMSIFDLWTHESSYCISLSSYGHS